MAEKRKGRGTRGRPDIWFRKSRGQWFAELNGKQKPLGAEEKAARIKFAELVAAQGEPTPLPLPTKRTRVSALEICDRFLLWVTAHRKPKTLTIYKHFVGSFAKMHGRVAAEDVRPFHVQSWVDAHEWTATTANKAISAVQRAWTWAEQLGILEVSRLRRMPKPANRRHEVALSEEQAEAVVGAAQTPALADAIRVMLATGMRVQEFRALEIRHLDRANRRAVLQWSEAKGERTRVIYFPPAAWEIVTRSVCDRKAGPLFRSSYKRAWTTAGLRTSVYRIGLKLKIADLSPRSFRHTFATTALARGVDALTVSMLMGHSDASTLSRIYQHLALRQDVLKEAAEKAGS